MTARNPARCGEFCIERFGLGWDSAVTPDDRVPGARARVVGGGAEAAGAVPEALAAAAEIARERVLCVPGTG